MKGTRGLDILVDLCFIVFLRELAALIDVLEFLFSLKRINMMWRYMILNMAFLLGMNFAKTLQFFFLCKNL